MGWKHRSVMAYYQRKLLREDLVLAEKYCTLRFGSTASWCNLDAVAISSFKQTFNFLHSDYRVRIPFI